MNTIEEEIRARLEAMDVIPLLGGLVPEFAAAALVGYAHSYLRRLAAAGQSPLPFMRRGNRRFYKVADIQSYLDKTVQG
ncbi:DNA-binding protein [Pseudomonas putida]|uniref:DNA-binding protein n=1 Tax=Pseudomonas putida group TaxID=136845 RepID=UPI001E3B462C|nr:DNA-binding protein [Pseudomonas putida]